MFYSTFKERIEKEYIVDRRGKVIKFLDVCDVLDYDCTSVDEMSINEVCSVHNEIATIICKNNGYSLDYPCDTLRKLGYAFIGGFGQNYLYSPVKPYTQSQINTLFDLGFKNII